MASRKISIRDRIAEAVRALFGAPRADRAPRRAFNLADLLSPTEAGRPTPPSSDMTDLPESYAEIAAVYAGVFAIAHSCASIPLKAYRRRAGAEPVPLDDHEILRLLDPFTGKPNDVVSGYDFWEEHASNLELAGNAYWLLDGPGVEIGRPPQRIYQMKPERVFPVLDGVGRPVRYELRVDGRPRPLLPEQVVHFKFFNPLSLVLGQSSIRAVRSQILFDHFANKFNRAFFENGAKLGPIIRFPDDVLPDDLRAAMAAFNEQHRGVGNAHKARGIAGALGVENVTTTHDDMHFYEGLGYSTARVLMALGVPPVLVTLLEGSHYENTEAQIKIFFRNTVVPKLTKRDATINRALAGRYDDDVFVAYDRSAIPSLRDDMKEIRETVTAFLDRESMTPNEARIYLQTGQIPRLLPLDGGDDVLERASASLDPTAADGGSGNDPSQNRARARRTSKSDAENVAAEIARDVARARAEYIAKAGAEAHARRESRVDERVGDLSGLLEAHFNAQERSLLEHAGSLAATFRVELARSGNPPLYSDECTAVFTNAMNPVDTLLAAVRSDDKKRIQSAYARAIGSFGKSAMKDLGRRAGRAVFDMLSHEVIEYVAKHAVTKLTHLDSGTADDVTRRFRRALAESQLSGDNALETAERIMRAAISDSFQSRRDNANRIARTELTGAYNFSEHEAWAQSGVVTERTWWTQADGSVRDGEDAEWDHAALHGTSKPIREPFIVSSRSGDTEALMYPGAPNGSAGNVINCRCLCVPSGFRSSAPIAESFDAVRRLRAPIFGEGESHA